MSKSGERQKRLRQMLREHGFYNVLRQLAEGADSIGRTPQLRILLQFEIAVAAGKRDWQHRDRYPRRTYSRSGPERELEHKLALQLIDIGYKTLARECHPDKGGSTDAMALLNHSRDHLKQMA